MEGKIPLIGEMFPDMSVVTTHGVMKLPEAYAGKWWILFSHPGDFTPVCTTEFVGFQQRYDQFKALNTELIGLSIDQVFSHLKWTEWIEEKMARLTSALREQQVEAANLDAAIAANLKELGYGG